MAKACSIPIIRSSDVGMLLRPRFSLRTLFVLVTITAIPLGLLSAWAIYAHHSTDRCVAVLNRLRDEINSNYGYKDGTPRVNCGPCIRFAIAFSIRRQGKIRMSRSVAFLRPRCDQAA